MDIEFKYVTEVDKEAVIRFFTKNITKDMVANHEFLCPFGISGAINRKQVMIALYLDEIIGGCRFYPRKKDNVISLYQFSIDKRFRGCGLLERILSNISQDLIFESTSPSGSGIARFYEKGGWIRIEEDDKKILWRLRIKDVLF